MSVFTMKRFLPLLLLLSIFVSIDHCLELMFNLYKTSNCVDNNFVVLVRQLHGGNKLIETAHHPSALSVDGYMYVVSNIHLSSEYSTEFKWIYSEQSMGGCCWSIQTPKIVDPHYNINVYPLATTTDVYDCFPDQSLDQAICSDTYTTGNFGFQSECQYNHTTGYFSGFTNCLSENNYTFHQDCNSNPTSMEGNYSTIISSTETTSMPMLSTDDNMPAPHQSATVTSSEETSITDDFQITATTVELLSFESTSSTAVTISSTALPDEITSIEETISTVFHQSTSTVDESSIMFMSITSTTSHSTTSHSTPSHSTPSHSTTSHSTPSHSTTSHSTTSHSTTSHNTPSHSTTSHSTTSHSTKTLITSTFANSVSSSSTIIVSSSVAPEQEEDFINQIQSIDTNSTDAAVTEFRTLIENVERTINSTEEIRSIIQVARNIIDSIEYEPSYQSNIYKSISNLLLTLDIFGGIIVEQNGTAFCPNENCTDNSNIILKVSEVSTPSTTVTYRNNNSISISFPTASDAINNSRVVSYYYRNLSTLLKPSDTKKSIVSPIISAYIKCSDCSTATDRVLVQFNLEDFDTFDNINTELSCVSINLMNNTSFDGVWDESGCTLETGSDNDAICNCTHLTHFAILLSPRLDITENDAKILNAIGFTLVPVSLVCMLAVILIYSFIRSLWNMRIFVHIMLCASLFISQLVFIVGVDKTENKDVCTSIAVVLEYLFLVTFMWMLMEGVVLYVSLTKVFIKNTRYYLVAFTAACFGIPALYMAIVIPIGFLVNTSDLNENTHFLYQQNGSISACWLNYESYFIWSFISPVIVIIMVNIGFFIMTVYILQKHEKKIHGKHAVRRWIKVSVSLTTVMGITWLGGVLAFTDKLVAVAYIMTILIASQGLIMFIILVLLSKQVREVFIRKLKKWFPDNYIINSTKLFSIDSKFSTGSNGRNRS